MKFNSFQIKLLMMLLMVLDHLSIIPGLLSFEAASILHFITRPVATWFAFTLVEGFIHTHCRLNYFKRLFFFALLTFAGNTLIMLTINPTLLPILPNIIFSLFLCFAMLMLYHDQPTIDALPPILRKGLGILVIVICILFGEGSFIMPLLVYIFYTYHDKPKTRNMWLLGLSLFMIFMAFSMVMFTQGDIFTFLYNEGWYILVIPFINLYNGKPGKKTQFAKYLFYLFYPVHIWIIYILAALIK